MDASLRRKTVAKIIEESTAPMSASTLAERLKVSRQVIVGDVALLRAQGHEILATARGYTTANLREENRYIGKVACWHKPEDTQVELNAIVDLEATVLDVIIDHDLYGQIAGQLNLKERKDVDSFLDRVKSSNDKLLADMTDGVHLHTIACRDKTHFEQVHQALDSLGFIAQ